MQASCPDAFSRYCRRRGYLEKAIPRGFHKKILIYEGKVVGTIEHAPAEASGHPITGDNVIIMNCVWVLRKAKGTQLLKVTNRWSSEERRSRIWFCNDSVREPLEPMV